MTRKYRDLGNGKAAVDDILCDCCGQTVKTLHGFEKAVLCASFEEGFHAGDRFIVEICQTCFDHLMVHILVDRMGTCMYHSEISGADMEMEDLREMYAHLRAGTLIYDEDDLDDFEGYEEEGCEE